MKTKPVLSKSNLLAYRQCAKRLWLEVHAQELGVDATEVCARVAEGRRVGKVAQEILGPGHKFDVMTEGAAAVITRTAAKVATTSRTLSRRKPLFEAGFEANGVRVFADAVIPVQGPANELPRWVIIEVKATTKMADVYYDDAAIQYSTALAAGLELDAIEIALVNNEWVFGDSDDNADEGNDYRGLLKYVDVTQEIQALVREVPSWVKAAHAVMASPEAPFIPTGAQCGDPYPCRFLMHCKSSEPAVKHPIQWLPRVQTIVLREHLAKPSVQDMRDVPNKLLNASQLRVKNATLTGRKYFDVEGAAEALSGYAEPIYFLDFETVGNAVPRWWGARAYQQIPFQFSLHRLGADGELSHDAFLDISGKDPRRALAKALIKACADPTGKADTTTGTIFTYNVSFEARCIRELAEYVGAKSVLGKALYAIAKRLADLAPVVREHFYHPSQQGSWSLKAVLPVLIPQLSYDSLDGVKNGQDAQLAYAEATDAKCLQPRMAELREQLLKYCELDTLALVAIWRKFSGKA